MAQEPSDDHEGRANLESLQSLSLQYELQQPSKALAFDMHSDIPASKLFIPLSA